MVRLFVGGLAESVTAAELAERFTTFGNVTNCVVHRPKEDDPLRSPGSSCRGFAHLDLEPANEPALRKCYAVYNGSKWKGGTLQVQPAHLHYVKKLLLEKVEEENKDKLEKAHSQQLVSGTATCSDAPLVLVNLRGEEIQVRSNKRKTSFPDDFSQPISETAWGYLRPPTAFLRKQQFEKSMKATFDAAAARQEWIASQTVKVPLDQPEVSDELGAVNFLDEGDVVSPLTSERKVMDLTRFDDGSDN